MPNHVGWLCQGEILKEEKIFWLFFLHCSSKNKKWKQKQKTQNSPKAQNKFKLEKTKILQTRISGEEQILRPSIFENEKFELEESQCQNNHNKN